MARHQNVAADLDSVDQSSRTDAESRDIDQLHKKAEMGGAKAQVQPADPHRVGKMSRKMNLSRGIWSRRQSSRDSIDEVPRQFMRTDLLGQETISKFGRRLKVEFCQLTIICTE